jgi:hypothetical protein
MHHIFTNSQLYDEDIKHEYKVYLYEFLYLKWRFDSLVSAITKINYVNILFILDGISMYYDQLYNPFLFL